MRYFRNCFAQNPHHDEHCFLLHNITNGQARKSDDNFIIVAAAFSHPSLTFRSITYFRIIP